MMRYLPLFAALAKLKVWTSIPASNSSCRKEPPSARVNTDWPKKGDRTSVIVVTLISVRPVFARADGSSGNGLSRVS